jgi:hypothetical protein
VRLQERYRRIYKTKHGAYCREVAYFRDFIAKAPALKAIVESARRQAHEVDAPLWIKEHFRRFQHDWPDTEAARAKIVWHLINEWADGGDPTDIAHNLSSERNHNEALRQMTEQVIEPFVEYLQEHLGTESEVLYLLELYKRRLEMFDRTRLFEAYERNTQHGEALYDADLRRFLLEHGVVYPYSQPASASGLADIVSGLEDDDPLVCEIKLYDGNQYGAPYLAKGLNQATQYAHDYGKTTAYLVVFNLSDTLVELPTDEEDASWPPRLTVAGVTVYLVAIRAKPTISASRQGKASPVILSRGMLVGETVSPE